MTSGEESDADAKRGTVKRTLSLVDIANKRRQELIRCRVHTQLLGITGTIDFATNSEMLDQQRFD
jgi:hypothetical protein